MRLFGSPGELQWGVENFSEHAERHVTIDEFVDVVHPATSEHPVVFISTGPEPRLRWIEGLVEQGLLPKPAVITDRDVILAVWPASVMPPE